MRRFRAILLTGVSSSSSSSVYPPNYAFLQAAHLPHTLRAATMHIRIQARTHVQTNHPITTQPPTTHLSSTPIHPPTQTSYVPTADNPPTSPPTQLPLHLSTPPPRPLSTPSPNQEHWRTHVPYTSTPPFALKRCPSLPTETLPFPAH